MNRAHASWVIYLSLVAALLFMFIPVPLEWRILRPEIAALTLFYWTLALPHRVGVATACTLGLLQDLIEGAPIGLSSPGLMLATLVLLFSYQRVRQYDVAQQSFVMLVLLLLSSGVEQWLRNGIDIPVIPLSGMLALLLSMLCWIPVRSILRHSRRHYEVY